SPRRVGSASPKWPCWRGASWRTPPPCTPPCPPASGIGLPARRPDGCAACWRRCISKTCRSCPSTFAKNSRPPRTCPQGSVGIADSKRQRPCAMISHSPHDTYGYRKVEYEYFPQMTSQIQLVHQDLKRNLNIELKITKTDYTTYFGRYTAW